MSDNFRAALAQWLRMRDNYDPTAKFALSDLTARYPVEFEMWLRDHPAVAVTLTGQGQGRPKLTRDERRRRRAERKAEGRRRRHRIPLVG